MNYFEWEGWPSREKVEKALSEALIIIDRNIEKYEYDFFNDNTCDGVYEPIENRTWGTGFPVGTDWLAYELTGDEKYRKRAEKHLDSFEERAKKRFRLHHHDLGFLYSLSAVAQYKLTGDERAKQVAIEAANILVERYKPKGEFIHAWGDFNDETIQDTEHNFLIVDCMLNIPLLYWASDVTGDTNYKKIGQKHLETTIKYIMRDDGSTFHRFTFDYETGVPVGGGTVQGAFDDSCWSRGQAWAIGGFALNYKATGNKDDIGCFKQVLDYVIAHLPEDKIPYWDFCFTDGDDEPRDASAAVIILCGIMEMAKYLPEDDEDLPRYKKVAAEIFNSIIDKYAAGSDIGCEGLVLHCTDSKPHNLGIDESCVWGDYFYMEAIARSLLDWNPYW